MKTDPVLIIEDNPGLLKVLTVFLEQKNCIVVTGTTAAEGLKKVSLLDINVILLDIMLPDGNGVDVLKQIHEISPQVPVIMMTGQRDLEIATECMRNGAVDYITKPFDFEKLYYAVQAHLTE